MNAHYLNQKICLRRYLRRLPFLLIAGTLSLSLAQASPIVAAPYITSPDNGQFVWARALGDTGRDGGEGVFVDGAGNVYTTGKFEGTMDFDPGPGAFFLTSPGWSAIFVSKLDSAGSFVWAKAFGGTGSGAGWSIFVDGSGNVFTTGVFWGTIDFDPGPGTFNLTSMYGADSFVSKLDSAGNFVWAKAVGGLDTDYGQSIFVDATGDVLTTGVFEGTADFDPGPGTYNLTGAGLFDIFISKLDEDGYFIWARGMGDEYYDEGYDVFVDGNGDIYTTGGFEGTVDFDPGPGTFNLASVSWVDAFISKLDSAGDFVWARAIGGGYDQTGRGIFVDQAGDVYTTGSFESTTDFDPGPGDFKLTSRGSGDVFISKLDNAGNFAWARAMGGASSEWATGIYVDAQGDIYTTGSFYGAADFDPGAGAFNLTSAGDADIFVSRLDSLGNFVWARGMGGPDQDNGYDIFVDVARNVYTIGWFESTVDFDPGLGSFHLTSAGDFDAFISKLGVAARILVANQAVRSGEDITITLTIKNQGPADGGSALLSIPAPANASQYTWTCADAGGAACPASGGSGAILHTLDAFPFGGEITYLATAQVTNPSQPVASHGTLTPPPGVNFTGSPRFHFGEFWNMRLPSIYRNASH